MPTCRGGGPRNRGGVHHGLSVHLVASMMLRCDRASAERDDEADGGGGAAVASGEGKPAPRSPAGGREPWSTARRSSGEVASRTLSTGREGREPQGVREEVTRPPTGDRGLWSSSWRGHRGCRQGGSRGHRILKEGHYRNCGGIGACCSRRGGGLMWVMVGRQRRGTEGHSSTDPQVPRTMATSTTQIFCSTGESRRARGTHRGTHPVSRESSDRGDARSPTTTDDAALGRRRPYGPRSRVRQSSAGEGGAGWRVTSVTRSRVGEG